MPVWACDYSIVGDVQAQRAAERGADADILKAADTLEKAQADLRAALAEKNKW